MKKLLTVCLVFILVCTLLCGCGGATVDLGDGPSVSREEAVAISEKDGKITGRLDLDRYSFAQLSEAEKEENVLSFDGDVIVFDGSYKGSVTLEGNGHKSKSSAEFQTNNSAPIRFTLTADYGSQDRYVVFIAGGHGSEGSDSDTTEAVTTPSTESVTEPSTTSSTMDDPYITVNGVRYNGYSSLDDAKKYPIPIEIDEYIRVDGFFTELYPIMYVSFIREGSRQIDCTLANGEPSHYFGVKSGDRLYFKIDFVGSIDIDFDHKYSYLVFDIE